MRVCENTDMRVNSKPMIVKENGLCGWRAPGIEAASFCVTKDIAESPARQRREAPTITSLCV